MGLEKEFKVFDRAYFNIAHVAINPQDIITVNIAPAPVEPKEGGEVVPVDPVYVKELSFTLNMFPHVDYEKRVAAPLDSRIGRDGVPVPGIKFNEDQVQRFLDLVYEAAEKTVFFKEGIKK